jgi:hypothetical protein
MMMMRDRHRHLRLLSSGRWRCARSLVREWVILELLGHVSLVLLRQLCGNWWSWATGGPFAYWDVSWAMLQGDAFWVIAVVCTSAIRSSLLAEWGHLGGKRPVFGRLAWLPWLIPGCFLGWAVLIRDDEGAARFLQSRAGFVFEGYHVLFFGYVAARMAACVLQLAAAARLLWRRTRRALASDGPWPYIPLGVAAVLGVALCCAVVYLHIYRQGGSFEARWDWFAPAQG